MVRFNLQCIFSRGNLWFNNSCNKSPGYLTSLYYCTMDKEEKQKPKPPYEWRTPWSEKEGEWYSKFKLFAPDSGGSPDFMRVMQSDLDLSPSKVKKWWERKKEEHTARDQRYIPQRHQTLGNDLATAHFIVHRGGAVRFDGSPHWLRADDNDNYNLPKHYVPDIKLNAVDASKTDIMYEGLENNVVGLKNLKLLKFRECSYIDDWCLDLITSEHANTVEILDLSYCTRITERGLSALHRMKKLKELHLEGIEATTAFKLTCVLLEESNPELVIHGVSHVAVPQSQQE